MSAQQKIGKKENIIFGSKEASNFTRRFFTAQNNLIGKVVNKNLDKRTDKIQVLLATCASTAFGITVLGDLDLYNESIMLARAYLEKLINFAYLLVCDKKEFENYLLHAAQKAYRKLHRKVEVEKLGVSLDFSGNIDIDKNPQLKEALQRFTSERGREKMRWTEKSIIDRIQLIKNRTKLNIGVFLMSILDIYEDSSEALHGTLYGCTFHSGAFDPTVDKSNIKELEIQLQQRITLLYILLGGMLGEVISLLSEKNDLVEIVEASKKNSQNIWKTIDVSSEGQKKLFGIKRGNGF